MKQRILFSLSLLLLCLNLSAQSVNNLVVFSQAGERFYLILNGVRQNIEPETNVKVVNLDQPSYKVKVIYENKSLPNVDKTIYFNGFGTEYVFQVVNKKGKYKIGYVSEAPIKKDATAAPDQKVIYYGQPADTVITTTTTTTTTTTNPTDNSVNVSTTGTTTNATTTANTTTNSNGISININDNGVSVNGAGVDMNVQTTGNNTNVNGTTTGTNTNNTTTNNNTVGADNSSRFLDNGTMCAAPSLTREQFVKVKFAIDERTLVTKMNVAKDYIKNNCMEAAQVAELVKLFNYASDQLELAKFSYQYTYDTKNYDLVVNAMSYEYNKPKLLEVIGTSGSSSTTTSVNTNNVSANNTSTTTTTTVVEQKVVTSGTTTNTVSSSTQGCSVPMSDADFSTAKKSIESKSFEESRLTLAKQIMKNKCLSVKQVKEIMLLFSFEQTRLDFAKLAYDYTVDKDNYYQLNDAFTFESSIEELNQYLESK